MTKSVLHVGAPVRVEVETEGAGTVHTQMVWDGMPQTRGVRKGLKVGEVKRSFTALDIPDSVSDVNYPKLVPNAQEVCLCVCVLLRGSACPFA